MIIKPSINELDKMVDNRYSLVCAVSKRAREIAEGSEPLVNCGSDKEVTIAVNELFQNKVRIEHAGKSAEEIAEDEKNNA